MVSFFHQPANTVICFPWKNRFIFKKMCAEYPDLNNHSLLVFLSNKNSVPWPSCELNSQLKQPYTCLSLNHAAFPIQHAAAVPWGCSCLGTPKTKKMCPGSPVGRERVLKKAMNATTPGSCSLHYANHHPFTHTCFLSVSVNANTVEKRNNVLLSLQK